MKTPYKINIVVDKLFAECTNNVTILWFKVNTCSSFNGYSIIQPPMCQLIELNHKRFQINEFAQI